MNRPKENNDIVQKGTLKITSSLTIKDVAQCYEQWKPYLATQFLEIDASDVKHIDTAGLQLLTYIVNTLSSANRKVVWTPEPSSAVIAQVKLAGLTKSLSFT